MEFQNDIGDIALLKVFPDFHHSFKKFLIPLRNQENPHNDLDKNIICDFAGWGGQRTRTSHTLKQLQLEIVTVDFECMSNGSLTALEESSIFAKPTLKIQNPERGDSGGPLICSTVKGFHIFGILKSGTLEKVKENKKHWWSACLPKAEQLSNVTNYSRFVDILEYEDWIQFRVRLLENNVSKEPRKNSSSKAWHSFWTFYIQYFILIKTSF